MAAQRKRTFDFSASDNRRRLDKYSIEELIQDEATAPNLRLLARRRGSSGRIL